MGGGGISSGFKVWFHRYWSIYTGFVVITDVLCMYKKERKLKIGWHKKNYCKKYDRNNINYRQFGMLSRNCKPYF